MGIEKDRRNRSGTGYKTTGVGSFGSINVSSAINVLNVALTGTTSLANLNVSSGFAMTQTASIGTVEAGLLNGAAAWRGVTTIASGDSTVVISASAATSGYPILLALGQTSVASHRDLVLSVSSLVDGISFLAEASGAVVDSQEICYTVIGG